MDPDKNEKLLSSTPINRRSMLKRVLIGGAVAYTAPVVATFALNGTAAGGEFPRGGNLTIPDWEDREPIDFGDPDPFAQQTPTAEPTPEPTVAPTVEPTAVPKEKKKPTSSGGAAPSFTG